MALLTAALDDDGRLVSSLDQLGYRGLVVAAMGGGSVPPTWLPALAAATARMPVVYCSRTGEGATLRATYGSPGSERDLIKLGAIPAGRLHPLKARVLLAALVAIDTGRDQVEAAFSCFDRPQHTGERLVL